MSSSIYFATMAICAAERYRCHKKDCDHMADGCFIDQVLYRPSRFTLSKS